MTRAGKVFATATEDMDALTFGSNVLLRNLTASEARCVRLGLCIAGLFAFLLVCCFIVACFFDCFACLFICLFTCFFACLFVYLFVYLLALLVCLFVVCLFVMGMFHCYYVFRKLPVKEIHLDRVLADLGLEHSEVRSCDNYLLLLLLLLLLFFYWLVF